MMSFWNHYQQKHLRSSKKLLVFILWITWPIWIPALIIVAVPFMLGWSLWSILSELVGD